MRSRPRIAAVMTRALALVIVPLTLVTGCTSPSAPDPIVQTYHPIELGNQGNFVNIDKTFFLGHRVERFRLRVRLVNPGFAAQWIPGIAISLGPPGASLQQFQDVPADAEPDGSFWTQEFASNFVVIRIRSGGTLVNFQGGQPRFEIVAVERYFLPGVDRNDLPTASTGARRNALTLSRGEDVIAFSPALGEAQHYRIPAATEPR